MQLSNTNNILKVWFGKYLPTEHIIVKEKPKKFGNLINLYFKRWFVQPILRKVSRNYLFLLRVLFGLKVVGITGSAGKTTTKDMIGKILSRKGKTVVSEKNIDPIYNIPLSILKCTPFTKYLVLEMGVEFVGEMDFYMWLVKPDISVITNVYPTHTQFFGDENGVFEEKVKIIKYLGVSDYAVVNRENNFLKDVKKHTRAKIVYFGKNTQIKADNVYFNDKSTKYTLHLGKSKINVHIPVLGTNFVNNSLAAVAVSNLLDVSLVDIKHGLEMFLKPVHRMNVFYGKRGAYIIDDSYNNNPEAAIATLKTFREIAKNKKKVIVFGDMLELGKLEDKYHKKLGKIISNLDIDLLVGVGNASKVMIKEAAGIMGSEKCLWVKDYKGVYNEISENINRKTAILIKGSRALKLDKVVDKLKQT